jgi:hypothetical protein
MKVSRSLHAYWQKQHKLEIRLQEEAKIKHDIIKQAAKKELEQVQYARYAQQLYLIKHARLGKNIDIEV